MSTLTQFLGSGSTAITGYTQTAVLSTSQTVTVPAGTKRIEALLCGGGGGGGQGGGGFGGLQIFEIPGISSSLSLVVGAGGTAINNGGTTTVSALGTILAAVGGGGGSVNSVPFVGKNGLYGGGGGGGLQDSTNVNPSKGGHGGLPFNGNILWSALNGINNTYPSFNLPNSKNTQSYYYIDTNPSSGGVNIVESNTLKAEAPPSRPGLNAGGGGSCQTAYNAPGGGGSGTSSGAGGNGGVGAGGGGGTSGSSSGGSLTGISVWGLTGKSGATTSISGDGGGGGGMIAAASGSSGGNGGGGGGGGSGVGGAGFAVFRFYY